MCSSRSYNLVIGHTMYGESRTKSLRYWPKSAGAVRRVRHDPLSCQATSLGRSPLCAPGESFLLSTPRTTWVTQKTFSNDSTQETGTKGAADLAVTRHYIWDCWAVRHCRRLGSGISGRAVHISKPLHSLCSVAARQGTRLPQRRLSTFPGCYLFAVVSLLRTCARGCFERSV